MTNEERTGFRDQTPSRLRRSFGDDKCYCFDVDMIEERWINDKRILVAVCDYKRNTSATDAQKARVIDLAKRLSNNQINKCKALIIRYHSDDYENDHFIVIELWPDKSYLQMDYDGFKNYIRNL